MSATCQSPRKKFAPITGHGFETRFCKTRTEKKRELNKLILAHSDVYAAFKTCEHFLAIIRPHAASNPSKYPGMDHPLYFPLIEAIVISYSRPFTPNDSLGELKKEWHKFPDARLQDAHRRILQARNELVAHSDMVVRKVVIQPPGDSRVEGYRSVGVGYGIKGYWFTVNQVKTFSATAGNLAKRLHEATEQLLEDLYDGMELPAKEFYLEFNDGL
jgi:hypothetical protein